MLLKHPSKATIHFIAKEQPLKVQVAMNAQALVCTQKQTTIHNVYCIHVLNHIYINRQVFYARLLTLLFIIQKSASLSDLNSKSVV